MHLAAHELSELLVVCATLVRGHDRPRAGLTCPVPRGGSRRLTHPDVPLAGVELPGAATRQDHSIP